MRTQAPAQHQPGHVQSGEQPAAAVEIWGLLPFHPFIRAPSMAQPS